MQKLEDEKRRILRAMDRSRKQTNLQYFDKEGSIIHRKKGDSPRQWHRSGNYKRLQNRLKEIYRKQAAVRRYQHECLANQIIAMGNNVYVENMKFSALAKQAKETTKNKKGKINSKKRFGKSIGHKAPAMLVSIVNRKLEYEGKGIQKISTQTAKASQYNHVTNKYVKENAKLSKRNKEIGSYYVQRDLYSAFLIMNIDKDLRKIDKSKCEQTFEAFLILHDEEIHRLKELAKTKKLPSSFGIKKVS